MTSTLQQDVKDAAARSNRDPTRMMDIVRDIQLRHGGVTGEAIALIAQELNVPRGDIEGVVTFYAFLSKEQKGRIVVRLSDCVGCRGPDGHRTADALRQELGIDFGQTTADGQLSLEHTACMGMCDQGPAALVNGVPIPGLTAERVKDLIAAIREKKLHAAAFPVADNIRKKGEVLLSGMQVGAGLRNALALSPVEVIAELKNARLRGRGGAGFPTGSKWEFARNAPGERKVIICNADEGEPGTFKDRVIFNHASEMVFEGMAIAGYAVGASEGILYLRAEYEYLRPRLDQALAHLRGQGLLGKDVGGKKGFDFDIRIQMGAGAYVCGEESALISSCEGRRGTPKDRPPFPVEKGYLGMPTSVNNVETFSCVARVLEKGAGWFSAIGTKESTGTTLLSVSGDCLRPGVYARPVGTTLRAFLKEVGGEDAAAVLVGGPSGAFVSPKMCDRKIAFEDLPTGGSMMVFGPKRDLLAVASDFMHFFIDESCGYCVPCRAGNVLLKERLDRVRHGHGLASDLAYLEELCTTVKKMSRCGLGQTSPNPIQTTLANFRELYEARLIQHDNGMQPSFDLSVALQEAARVQGRAPVFHDED